MLAGQRDRETVRLREVDAVDVTQGQYFVEVVQLAGVGVQRSRRPARRRARAPRNAHSTLPGADEVVARPVDVEPRRGRRLATVAQQRVPPRVSGRDRLVVRHDVEQHAEPGCVRGIGERFESGAAAELGIDLGRVDDVVTVPAPEPGGEHGREVQPVDAEVREVRHHRARGGEIEVGMELEAVRGDRRTGHRGASAPSNNTDAAGTAIGVSSPFTVTNGASARASGCESSEHGPRSRGQLDIRHSRLRYRTRARARSRRRRLRVSRRAPVLLRTSACASRPDPGAAARGASRRSSSKRACQSRIAACGSSVRRDHCNLAAANVSGACRVRRFLRARELRELGAPSAPHRLDQRGIRVVDEVRERARLAVLLAHEEQWEERRAQHGGGGDPQPIVVHDGAQPIPDRTVSDLVVVLGEHDEALARQARPRTGRSDGRATPSTAPRRRTRRDTR